MLTDLNRFSDDLERLNVIDPDTPWALGDRPSEVGVVNVQVASDVLGFAMTKTTNGVGVYAKFEWIPGAPPFIEYAEDTACREAAAQRFTEK